MLDTKIIQASSIFIVPIFGEQLCSPLYRLDEQLCSPLYRLLVHYYSTGVAGVLKTSRISVVFGNS